MFFSGRKIRDITLALTLIALMRTCVLVVHRFVGSEDHFNDISIEEPEANLMTIPSDELWDAKIDQSTAANLPIPEPTGKSSEQPNLVRPVESERKTSSQDVATDVQSLRKRHMDKTCRRFRHRDILRDKNFLRHVIVDDVNKVLYCYVPKVACTNWKRTIAVLSGQTNVTDPLLIQPNHIHRILHLPALHSISRLGARHRINTYQKFMFTRDPFDRLVSAYRNKFQGPVTKGVFNFKFFYGREIIRRFRKNPSRASLSKGHDVTFKEFVQYVTNRLTKKPLNEHWQPMYQLCRPCEMNYTFIGKYETLVQDAKTVIDSINKGNLTIVSPFLTHRPKNISLASFRDQLSVDDLQRFYALYRSDFELFNYTIEPPSNQSQLNPVQIEQTNLTILNAGNETVH